MGRKGELRAATYFAHSKGSHTVTPSIGRALLGALVSFGILTPTHGAQAGSGCSDIALVLAIDVSGSVSPGEFLLEKRGIAAAFRDPSVLMAIKQAGSVRVSAVFWGDDKMPKTHTDWVSVDRPLEAEHFAHILETTPRQATGDTGLGAGMATALGRLMSPSVCATRRIINVSGDGKESPAVRGERRSTSPSRVRDMASKANVEINALSIAKDDPGLAEYYARNVITGPDPFVLNVHDYRDFAEAIRRKLIREINSRTVSELPSNSGLEADNYREHS